MKWRSRKGRQLDEASRHKQGDRITITRFTFLPKTMSNEDVVWLQRYVVKSYWSEYSHSWIEQWREPCYP